MHLPACPPAGGSSLQEAAAQLKQRLAALASPWPGEAAGALSPDQVAQVARFLASTILQHYGLYCLVYCQEQQHVEHRMECVVGGPAVRRVHHQVHAVAGHASGHAPGASPWARAAVGRCTWLAHGAHMVPGTWYC